MDFSLQSDPEHRVLLVTLGKIVTEASALAVYTAVEQFIVAEGPHSGITDLSYVEKLNVSSEFIRCLAAKPGWNVAHRGGSPNGHLRRKPDVPAAARQQRQLRRSRPHTQGGIRATRDGVTAFQNRRFGHRRRRPLASATV